MSIAFISDMASVHTWIISPLYIPYYSLFEVHIYPPLNLAVTASPPFQLSSTVRSMAWSRGPKEVDICTVQSSQVRAGQDVSMSAWVLIRG